MELGRLQCGLMPLGRGGRVLGRNCRVFGLLGVAANSSALQRLGPPPGAVGAAEELGPALSEGGG